MTIESQDFRLEVLSAREVEGVVVELRTQALVTGLTDTTPKALFNAMENAGLPTHGSTLADFPNLEVVERAPTIDPNSPSKAKVDIVYGEFHGEGQRIKDPNQKAQFSGSVSLQQITTQMDNYDISKAKQITLTHTFSDGTAAYKDGNGNTVKRDEHGRAGKEVPLTGEINVLSPNATATLTGIMEVSSGHAEALKWAGKVNSAKWGPSPPRTWLITNVAWSFHGFQKPKTGGNKTWYKFAYTFEYDKTGWDPQAIYIDPETGRVPVEKLKKDKGYKTIEWYPSADFNDIFKVDDESKA